VSGWIDGRKTCLIVAQFGKKEHDTLNKAPALG
jgi:hypothetical protein